MSEEDQGTLNTESSGESSQPVATHQTEDLVPTVDQPIPEAIPQEEPPPEEAPKTEDPTDGEEEAVKDEEEEVPFHKHPRWQQIMRENKALKEQAAETAEKQNLIVWQILLVSDDFS